LFNCSYKTSVNGLCVQRQWLDILEETKKKKLALNNQRKEAAQDRHSSRSSLRPSSRLPSRYSSLSLDPSNPFSEEEEEEETSESLDIESDFLEEEWLQELPEDLDVCIAQRNFEGAVDLMDKGTDYFDVYFPLY